MTESTMHMTTTPKPGTVRAMAHAMLGHMRKSKPGMTLEGALAELSRMRPDIGEGLARGTITIDSAMPQPPETGGAAESRAALSSVVQAELAELRKHNPDLDEAEAFAELCKRRPDLDEALNAPHGVETTGKVDDPDEAMRQELAELRKWNKNATEEEAFASLCRKRPDLDERLNGPGRVPHE